MLNIEHIVKECTLPGKLLFMASFGEHPAMYSRFKKKYFRLTPSTEGKAVYLPLTANKHVF